MVRWPRSCRPHWKNGPPPGPPAGDGQSRRVTLDAMLEYFNNQAQPPADDVKITDHEVATATTPDPNIAPLAGWSYDDNATGWNALLGAGHESATSTLRPRPGA
jgi:hypothetical protein